MIWISGWYCYVLMKIVLLFLFNFKQQKKITDSEKINSNKNINLLFIKKL